MKHYEFEISQFVDGELNDTEKRDLFLHLSGCSECQKVFSEYLTLKEKSKDFCAEKISVSIKEIMPVSINDAYAKIADTRKWNLFYKSAFYISSAAAVVLLFLTITHKPVTEIATKSGSRPDTVFVAESRNNQKTQAGPGSNEITIPVENSKDYLKYVMGLRTAEIKKSEIIEVVKGVYE